jgi:hypothetical protein
MHLSIFNFKEVFIKFFVQKIFIFFLPITIFLIFINYIEDPGNLYSPVEIEIAKLLSKGYNVTGSAVSNLNERSLHRQIINLRESTPEIILLGSSRTMLIGKDNFKNKTFLNHSVSGASIEDLIAIFQLYKNKNKLPKKVIIGIDPWLFNKNNGQIRWKTLRVEYDLYNKNISKTTATFKNLNVNNYFELLSPSYFQASIKMLLLKMRKGKDSEIKATEESLNDSLTRVIDGTISYDLKYRNASSLEILSLAKQYIEGDIYSLGQFDDISSNIVLRFESFIDDLKKNSIQVEFILMPYHPLVYSHMIVQQKYSMVSKVEKYIKEYADIHYILTIGSYNPYLYKLNNNDFYDGMHLNSNGVRKVLYRE